MAFYLFIIIKFIIGFVVVITHLNLSGKTQLAQMTPVDFIGNFVLGGIIGGVIYTSAIPLYQYVIVLLIGVSMISILNFVSKHLFFFRDITIGNPIPIIENGKFVMENILEKHNKIDIINVASQLHSQGIYSFQKVSYAQIEPSGQLTAIVDSEERPSILIMQDGKIRDSELEGIEKSKEWLEDKIKAHKIDPEQVFLAEFWENTLSFIMRDAQIIRTAA